MQAHLPDPCNGDQADIRHPFLGVFSVSEGYGYVTASSILMPCSCCH